MTRKKLPLWTCPKCGARLITKNLWHSCGRATLDDWKQKMTPAARALYDRFESMIAACGEYYVAPARTRISFLALIRFANITKVSEQSITCSFALPEPLRSPRFAKVQEVVPGWWVHHLKITDPSELDDEVQGWIRQSYHFMGMRERWGRRRGRHQ